MTKQTISFTAKIDAKLKERAMDIIQNKLKITVRAYIEQELRELVKRHEPKK